MVEIVDYLDIEDPSGHSGVGFSLLNDGRVIIAVADENTILQNTAVMSKGFLDVLETSLTKWLDSLAEEGYLSLATPDHEIDSSLDFPPSDDGLENDGLGRPHYHTQKYGY